jgi:hypothetical protein
VSIGTIGFPFFFSGTDYGKNNDINWYTDQILFFGNNLNINYFGHIDYKGIMLGYAKNRRTNWLYSFDTYTSNGNSIKRFIVSQGFNDKTITHDMQMEIRLIRDTTYQYIEVRMGDWSDAAVNNSGSWYLENTDININIYYEYQSLYYNQNIEGMGKLSSFVLRSDLLGNNWKLFTNYYVGL